MIQGQPSVGQPIENRNNSQTSSQHARVDPENMYMTHFKPYTQKKQYKTQMKIANTRVTQQYLDPENRPQIRLG